MGGITAPPIAADVVQTAVAAAMPPFATMLPRAEGGAAALGAAKQIPYADHQHPRLTATARGTLDANGDATVTFTQVFDVEPAVTVISIGAKAAGKTVPDFDVTFVTDANGKFTGCTIYGRRARALPQQQPVSVLAVLTGVITGVNNLVTSLTGYDTTEPAAGAGFSLIAVKTSQVA